MNHELSELTTHCIRCGFCLESCPTFKITGEETESPRGRIYLIRSADEGKLGWHEIEPHVDRCLGCRACETACPSGVEYGAILELARERLGAKKGVKVLLGGLTDARIARLQFTLARLLPGKRPPGLVNRMLGLPAPEADLPRPGKNSTWPPLADAGLPQIKGEVYLLEGCVMRVLYPRVHEATRRLLRRVGFTVREIDLGCCGALHAHSGLLDEARSRAQALATQTREDLPILVNSAGCGSTMKEYGFLDEGLSGTAKRVVDLSEFLLDQGLLPHLANQPPRLGGVLTYHDACHLAHGQKVTHAPRELLRAIPGVTFRELEEADTCCGSAGIYNALQPTMARKLLDRKWGCIVKTEAGIVATGNPGCHAWMEQAAREAGGKVRVLHTAEVLEAAFSGA